jgi:radical SAM family uncharacterized protein
MMPSVQLKREVERILPTVRKPGRYTGGELNQIIKDWESVEIHFALAFPDIYDLGMSNLGLMILYDLINKQEHLLAERVFSPWPDMEQALREKDLPLFSLESRRPLRDFDLLGISLPYESLYTNAVNLLDLGGIPVLADHRGEEDPIVIAGGHATLNPEPMAAFIDAFVIGEGEEVILEIAEVVRSGKQEGISRLDQLESLARIWGVYVPSLYEPGYTSDGTLAQIISRSENARMPVLKRIVAKLPPPVTNFIVPYIEVTHDRIPIEIMRGCTRGCRFCQAGMITRPVRERSVNEIVSAIESSIANTGLEQVGLLSLSSSDHDEIIPLVKEVSRRFQDRNIRISLPSLRIESVSVDLMDELHGNASRSGFTLAPEAATERMREIINKPVSTHQLLETAREIYKRGWHTIKLYFMIGHPEETLEDVQAIADLCKSVLAVGQEVMGKRARVHAGVSTFVPKPHTPFQWVPCDTREQIDAKQTLLKSELRGRGLKLNLNSADETHFEAWLSRGDRRVGAVILEAWKRGAKFDAWREYFDYKVWLSAFEHVGLDPDFYTHRERPIDEPLPWDHIDAAVKKEFLTEDYLWSKSGQTRVDCRERCFACGILPKYAQMRRENPGQTWECPEVKSPKGKTTEIIPLMPA